MLNNVLKEQEDIQRTKKQVLARFPLLGVTMASLSIEANDRVGTAATNGHKIIYSPKFFATLSDEQKQFVFAHEVMHVAFNHIMRSKGRNQKLWNTATDSVINQMLKSEQLPMIKGGVDIAEAINHSAEEMYEKLLKKKKQREEEKKKKQQEQSGKDNQQTEQSGENGPPQQGQSGENNQEQEKNADQQQSQSGENDQEQQGETEKNDQQQDQQSSGEEQNQQSSEESNSDDADWDDSGVDWDDEDEQVGHDSHDIWKEAVEEAERQSRPSESKEDQTQKKPSMWDRIKKAMGLDKKQEEDNQQKNQSQEAQQQETKQQSNQSQENQPPDNEKIDDYEKGFLSENQTKRHEMAEQIREQLKKERAEVFQNGGGSSSVGEVGETKKPVMNWKKLLKSSIEEENDRWSSRRASAENGYMSRIETFEDESKPDTEVMLDVSGSVNIYLLREFLRQLKPLLKSSKLRVGCFDDKLFGFTEIKSNKDIDNFQLPNGYGGGTDLDLAVRGFSKKKDVNRIIFTDGYGFMPSQELKSDSRSKNVFWLVYDHPGFKPCIGKVIQVNRREMCSYMQSASLDSSRG